MTEETSAAPSVYVDANPFIYFIEGDESVAKRLKPFFDMVRSRPGAAVTSELTLAEVLAKARPDVRRNYLNLIVWSNLFRLQPVTREILIDTSDYRRTSIRALPGGRTVMPKLPDAIHVVTAARSRCGAFLSADSGLHLPSGMIAYTPSEDGIGELLRRFA